MEKLKKLDRSRLGRWMVLGAVFLTIFVLTSLTPYLADDYTYHHSWYDWARLTSIWQIPASIYAHGMKMNGRLVSHGLEQLFLLMPKLIFNLCNAAVYTWTVWEGHRICTRGRQPSLLILTVVALGMWVFMPVFGAVTLWQVGSLNYFWSIPAVLLFLRPYVSAYLTPEPSAARPRLWKRVLFIPYAFLVGMYSEIASFAGILMALGFLLLLRTKQRRVPAQRWLWLPLLAAVAGYVTMVTLPAELKSKAGDYSLFGLLNQFTNVVRILGEYHRILLLCWAVLMALSLVLEIDGKKRMVSLAFGLGALAAAFVMTGARNVPPRGTCVTAAYLLIACGVLMAELLHTASKPLCAGLAAALCVTFLLSFPVAANDILTTYRAWRIQDARIRESVAAGETAFVIEWPKATSPYNGFYGRKSLSRTDPEKWLNREMAFYYGLESLLRK